MIPMPMHNKQGMTLVEVLVAIALLAIGIAGILEINLSLTQSLLRTKLESRAAYLMEDRLATLEAAGYEALGNKMQAAMPTTNSATVELFPDFVPVQKNTDFRWNAQLSRQEPMGVARIQILVSIQWQEKGVTRTRKATGYAFAP